MNIATAFPSKYLKAAELEDDTTYTVRDVQMESVGQGQDAEEKPVLYFDDTEKGLVLNKTNSDTISKQYGYDTDGWVGKPVTLYATDVAYQGKTSLGIRVRLRAAKPAGKPVVARPAAASSAPAKPAGGNGITLAQKAFAAKTPGWTKPDRNEAFNTAFAEEYPATDVSEMTAEQWQEFADKIDADYDAATKAFLVF